MHAPALAIAWEIWAANRRGWLLLVAAIPCCALLFGFSGDSLRRSEGLLSLSFLPMVLSLILVMAFCNFTDRERGKTFAGFPQRLFTLPVRTGLLVTCPMLFGVVSIVGIYVAWAKLVFGPAGIDVLVRWPATLLAAGMVSYQAIIWCLSGFRFLRLITLSVMLTLLVAVGLLPYALAPGNHGRLEGILTAALAALTLVAYGAAVVAVASQRRGGGRGWQWPGALRRALEDALPRSKRPFASPERALLWLEWRHGGLVLPTAVLLTVVLIVGPATWLAGRGPEATARAALWLALLPMILALPVGKGLAKPDFWSLELGLSPFLTTRPIKGSQIIAAKMKAAALSTLLAWALLLTMAPLWLGLAGDAADLYSLWQVFRAVYSPFAQVAIPILLLVAAVIMTWSLLVGGIWAGLSGRPVVFAGSVVFGIVCFLSVLAFATWWSLDEPGDGGDLAASWLPGLPWLLASAFLVKAWGALVCWRESHRRGLLSDWEIAVYLSAWALATGSVAALAWLVSPRVAWFRDLLLLAALLLVPLARIGAAPLALQRNRHR